MATTTSEPVVLYCDALWESPFVFSSLVAVRAKELSVTVKDINLEQKEQLAADYQNSSITARVPAIKVGNFHLAESSAIAEYLDEKFPNSGKRLIPKDIEQRARARQLMAWWRSDLMALREERPTSSMFLPKSKALPPLSEKAQQAVQKLFRITEQIIPESADYLFGGEWHLIDSELALLVHRLVLNNDVVPPKTLKYAQFQWKNPAVQEFVNHKRI